MELSESFSISAREEVTERITHASSEDGPDIRQTAMTAHASTSQSFPVQRPRTATGTSNTGSMHSVRSRTVSSSTILLETCGGDDEPLMETIGEDGEVIPDQGTAARRLPRLYYLDWMRVIAIYLVVCYHVVQALDWIGFWCEFQHSQSISFRCVALQVGMPMFFHISGRAQARARLVNFRKTLGDRFMRLILPFIICFIILIPPWIWVHEYGGSGAPYPANKVFDKTTDFPNLIHHGPSWMCLCARDDAWTKTVCDTEEGFTPFHVHVQKGFHTVVRKNDFPNLFVYLWRFWTGGGGPTMDAPMGEPYFKLDPGWLWFLPILFLVNVSSTPLFLYAENQQMKYLVPIVLWGLVEWLLSWQILGYDWQFGAFLMLPQLTVVLTVIKVPLPAMIYNPTMKLDRFMAIRVVTLAHIVATVGAVVSFRYQDIDNIQGYSSSAMRAVPQMFMYPLFYTQGFFAQRYWPEAGSSKDMNLEADEIEAHDAGQEAPNFSTFASIAASSTTKLTLKIKIFQFGMVLVTFLIVFLGSPIGDWEFSAWPVYSGSFHDDGDLFAVGYVLSTWAWIGVAVALFQAYATKEFDHELWKHAGDSTIIVYIFHWAFLKPFVFFVIRDFGLCNGYWRTISPIITFVFAAGGSLVVYALLVKYPAVGIYLGVGKQAQAPVPRASVRPVEEAGNA